MPNKPSLPHKKSEQMSSGLKVTAPVTISNLNCGFDCLGLATDMIADEIIGRRTDQPGIRIKHIVGPGKIGISLDPGKNTAGVAIRHFLEYSGNRDAGIEIEMHKHISAGSGLGSSGASACAAVILANALFQNPLTLAELIPLAVLGEYISGEAFHADNVAPCMLGGVILVRDLRRLDFQRLNIPSGLSLTIVQPELQILTSESRQLLSSTIPLKKMVHQSANLGALVLAFERSDFSLMRDAMQDHIIEPQRKHLIPGFDAVCDAAYTSGALACGISGSGPALFAFSENTLTAEQVALGMQKAFAKYKIESRYSVTRVSAVGAELQ
jgi:homoserine kinase